MTPAAVAGGQETPEPPGMARRMACFLYEGVLLFGLLMMAAYLYSSLTQQRHALQGKLGLQAFLFVLLGIYFGWFWSRGGQTLAMKTWHLRVVRTGGLPLTQARAVSRYVLSWLWFLPGLALSYSVAHNSTLAIFGSIAAGVVAYALIARLRRDQRFLHDVVCDCKVIDWRPAAGPSASHSR